MFKKQIFFILSVFILSHCGFGDPSKLNIQSVTDDGEPLSFDYTSAELAKALNSAAKSLINRLPAPSETARAVEGIEGYESVIREYLESPAFQNNMVNYHKNFFDMAGTDPDEGINYNLPTNMAVYIIINNLDYREILTGTYCVDDNIQKVPCSSFNGNEASVDQNAAGVITTKAFLFKWDGPYNFRRVRMVFNNFACSEYPDANDTSNFTEQEIAGVNVGATADFKQNVTAPRCYGCHRSINPRAALFFQFDRKGNFVNRPITDFFTTNPIAQNDNEEDPELAISNDAQLPAKIYQILNSNQRPADSVENPGENYSPVASDVVPPRYKGQPVSTVRQYATTLANDKTFRRCLAQRFTNFLLNRPVLDPLQGDLDYLVRKVEEHQHNVKDVIVEITKSRPFVIRK